jgi:hypothetical protein
MARLGFPRGKTTPLEKNEVELLKPDLVLLDIGLPRSPDMKSPSASRPRIR